jgi:hypothetical protein
MKRNETASSTTLLKLVAVVVAVALSGCAVTGPASSDDLSTEMFNDVHYGP